ncbi:MAG: hypothetical protein DRN33_02125 [Thermoplasmata archaeon]|nr:MAG: hypothetical protein FE043_02860 [Thermoplasmata archaeon]RLF64488.1 MAG: hypothetical protein DRN33_02125 [Thermoplasmata archaeon]
MKGFLILWFLLNLIAFIASLVSIQYSQDTIFTFPYFHLLGIISLFAIINLPFYMAYERLRDEKES